MAILKKEILLTLCNKEVLDGLTSKRLMQVPIMKLDINKFLLVSMDTLMLLVLMDKFT